MRDYAELVKALRYYGAFEQHAKEAADAIEELLKRPEIPETGIGDLSDGYHTFNGLYYQRMILFASLVRAYKDRAWKSYRHEDGELCFGGGWFIVGIDTPEGSYTYHYENKDFDRFDCVELPCGKHWDGHTEDDVTRLLSLPTISPDEVRGVGEWEDAKQNGKRVLDPCCGSKMFWFDKDNPDVEFCDIRELHTTLCDGRKLDVAPDTISDFRNLPFESDTFWHVVFDPPHMTSIGDNSWMTKKYGKLTDGWEQMLKAGFDECMRVLKPNGTLIFKWNEQDVPVSKILNVVGYKPLYGHKSGKLQKTHWMAFIKDCPNCGARMGGVQDALS